MAAAQHRKGLGKGNREGVTVRAAPGPGTGVTPASLTADLWSKMEKTWVLEFYGHSPSQKYGCFSNFFEAPFVFVVPKELCAFELSLEKRTVPCDFSEKAIMLCKAAAMGDQTTYSKIAGSKQSQGKIKAMGREVSPFSESLWQEIVCSVAFEVVYQKFSKIESLKHKLLATQDWVIAEATRNDANWGIGLNCGEAWVHEPQKWQGTNILGWALMQTREALRHGEAETASIESGSTVAAGRPADATRACQGYSQKPIEVRHEGQGLTDHEKAFLKAAKKVREIFKLEQDNIAGKPLDKNQAQKLESKHSLLVELSILEGQLPSDSEIRTKNQDLVQKMKAHFQSST